MWRIMRYQFTDSGGACRQVLGQPSPVIQEIMNRPCEPDSTPLMVPEGLTDLGGLAVGIGLLAWQHRAFPAARTA